MPDTPRNIELFNRVAGVVLLRLYESFPARIVLDPQDLGTVATDGFTTDEEEVFQVLMEGCEAAIEFLGEEGFLSYTPDRGGGNRPVFSSARLTMKGLAIMGTPSVIVGEKPESLGGQLKSALDEGAHSTVAALVGQAFGAAVGAGWRAVAGVG
jgi:hypothetical protein